tara:strand:- start:758 stop:1057 length:300 start_codon:yes stop_codon:yes gene_type:complete
MQTESDPINPNHYKAGDIECIDAIKASLDTHAFHGYLKASVMKYLWRYDKKNDPDICLQKAQWFMNRLVKEHINEFGSTEDLWTIEQVEADAEDKPAEF